MFIVGLWFSGNFTIRLRLLLLDLRLPSFGLIKLRLVVYYETLLYSHIPLKLNIVCLELVPGSLSTGLLWGKTSCKSESHLGVV